MKLEDYTCALSLALLALAGLHTLLYSGLTGLLFSAAIGLLLLAFVEPFELVAAMTILVALLYTTVLKKYLVRFEGFQASPDKGGFEAQAQPNQPNQPNQIVKRVAALQGPQGVYSAAIEGFEDVQPDAPKEGASSNSSQAPAKPVDAVAPEIAKVTAAKDKDAKDPKRIEKEEFQSATNELFKIGKMPSEHKEGPLLDVGQTVMKAVNSLDPNTISAMTADTKKLLETQKGLMNMLTQMRPVLADGKELLQTFSGMFSGAQ